MYHPEVAQYENISRVTHLVVRNSFGYIVRLAKLSMRNRNRATEEIGKREHL